MLRLSVLAACALALAACATPYQQSGITGGFNVIPLGQDVYRVSFGGNGFTTQETAQVYWLNRAAELTLEKGFASFEILSDMHFVARQPAGRDAYVHDAYERDVARLAVVPTSANVTGSGEELSAASLWRTGETGDRADPMGAPVRLAASTFIFVPAESSVPKPAIQGDIHLLSKAVEPTPPKLFNARELEAALQPLIKAEKCDMGNICPHVHAYLLPKGKLQ